AEQLDELADARLVALLLEVRPGELVHRDAVDRRLLELDRSLVRGLGAIVVEGPARGVDLVEVVVADEPPHLGDVPGLGARERLLRDRLAIVGEGVLEAHLVVERRGRELLVLLLALARALRRRRRGLLLAL